MASGGAWHQVVFPLLIIGVALVSQLAELREQSRSTLPSGGGFLP